MKSTRPMLLTVLVALLLAIVPATFAQDLTLPPELQTALTNTSTATSARFNFTLDIAATGEEAVDLSLSGTGLYGPDLFQLTITGDLPAGTMGTEAMPLNAEFRAVDGSLYIYFPMMMPQWIEVSPEELEQGLNGVPIDLTDIGSMSNAGSMEGMDEAMAALGQVANFVTIAANGNVTSIDVDIIGLLSSPEVQQMIIDNAVSEDASVDPAEIQSVLDVAPAAFAGSAIHSEFTVGDDSRLSNMLLNLDLNVDPTQLPADAQEEMGLSEPATVSFDFNLGLSDYDADFSSEVEAPSDAMPLSQLMGSMMGS